MVILNIFVSNLSIIKRISKRRLQFVHCWLNRGQFGFNNAVLAIISLYRRTVYYMDTKQKTRYLIFAPNNSSDYLSENSDTYNLQC